MNRGKSRFGIDDRSTMQNHPAFRLRSVNTGTFGEHNQPQYISKGDKRELTESDHYQRFLPRRSNEKVVDRLKASVLGIGVMRDRSHTPPHRLIQLRILHSKFPS